MQLVAHDRVLMGPGMSPNWVRGRHHEDWVTRKTARQHSISRAHSSRREIVQSVALIASSPFVPVGLLQPDAALSATSKAALVPMTDEQKKSLDKVFGKVVTKVKAPVLLRLAFHDAATYRLADESGGPNASVQYELDRPENTGLKRGWSCVTDVRKKLQGTDLDAELSNADIIAALGAFSVKLCKGPDIPVKVGRIDASSQDPTGRLPSETAPITVLKACFADAGLSTKEFVCLCGAHTLGTKGFGDPSTFDNFYFNALLKKPWNDRSDPMADMIGLPSDRLLPEDPECTEYIMAYAKDQKLFLSDFSSAYGKLTSLGYA